ncbi:MAG: tRNA (N(6)-L-threonylcarbamoyladenosine(37)-C(2))-methylthiotransferase MtaB [Bacteroidales bacterium]|nr:tRNA (N(6)-L-threonylcarbamoyladenosine(37)-C(2))-methylthiotransferase MtaB [Bacteroidales bacterium]
MKEKQKIAFFTLGCRLNFSETSNISRDFEPANFEHVTFSQEADIYVINSCMVTEKAERKCRDLIKKTHTQYPNAEIVVIGCYSQLKHEEIKKIPGVSLVLGNQEKFNLLHFLEKKQNKEQIVSSCEIMQTKDFHSSFSLGGRTRSFVKIQDGCDYNCAYCTIPLARGKSRNSSIEEIFSQTEEIYKNGVQEIILTGVNIGDFGKSNAESLFKLLKKLEEKSKIPRIRISSIEPDLVGDNLIDLFAASEKLLPHFHLPLQSGNDKILGLMRRRYKRDLFEKLTLKLVDRIPFVSVGTDIITAFPGETEDDFVDGLEFVKSLPLSHIHVFSYSPRKNTVAIDLPGKVSSTIAKERSKLLHIISEEKEKQFIEKNLGKKRKVLFENKNKNHEYQGYTDNYIKIISPSNRNIKNEILFVELLEMNEKREAIGKIISQ